MGATRTSTLGSGVGTSSGDLENGGSTATYTSEVETYLGSTGSSSFSGAQIQGAATAYGTDTFADLSIDAQVSDSSLHIDFEATAAAQSQDPFAYAHSTASIEIYGSAHAYVGVVHRATWTQTTSSSSSMVSTYEESINAVNPGGGSTSSSQPDAPDDVLAPYMEPDPGGADISLPHDDCGCGTQDPLWYEIDGNLAIYDIDIAAFGIDSYAELMMDAIVVEDAFSDVTAVVIIAI